MATVGLSACLEWPLPNSVSSTAPGGALPGSRGTGVGSGGVDMVGGTPGSGGTGGVASVGSVDGFGSVIVNGVRYDDTTATVSLEDVTALGLGMVARVTGSLQGTDTGVASRIESAPELIGAVETVDAAQGLLRVMGSSVQAGSATFFIGATSVAALSPGDLVRVHGVPMADGLSATRIEVRPALTAYQVTGFVQGLDTVARTARVGSLTVAWGAASFSGLSAGDLADGMLVQWRGNAAPVAGVFTATRVKAWLGLNQAPANGGNVHLRGVVGGLASLGDFRVLGVRIDASGNGVQFNVASSQIGNGSEVQIRGRWSNGTLVAQRVTVLSGAGGSPVVYRLIGSTSQYNPAEQTFRLRGERVKVDPAATLTGGTTGDLANGVALEVTGTRFVGDTLQATSVTFTRP